MKLPDNEFKLPQPGEAKTVCGNCLRTVAPSTSYRVGQKISCSQCGRKTLPIVFGKQWWDSFGCDDLLHMETTVVFIDPNGHVLFKEGRGRSLELPAAHATFGYVGATRVNRSNSVPLQAQMQGLFDQAKRITPAGLLVDLQYATTVILRVGCRYGFDLHARVTFAGRVKRITAPPRMRWLSLTDALCAQLATADRRLLLQQGARIMKI